MRHSMQRVESSVAGPDDEMARKREAFLAAERTRRDGAGQAGRSSVGEQYQDPTVKPERSLVVAYLLWFILGQISAHRFYLGAYKSAALQLGLMVAWIGLALGAPRGSYNMLGPLLAVLVIGWILWILGDLFLIHRIHRARCRRPGEAARVAEVFA
jgi:hypothetical protein